MNKTSKTLVVLTPAFPANEFETVWVRPKQLFIRKLQEDFPTLNIIILSFNYPLHKKEYLWRGIKVIPFNGLQKRRLRRVWMWISVWRKLTQLRKEYDLLGLFSFWCGECALVGKRFAAGRGLKHFAWISGMDAKKENNLVKLIRPEAEGLIAMSVFLQKEFYRNHSVKAKHIIPIGIDPAEFDTREQKRTIDILGVGSLNDFKQYDMFIRIVKQLSDSFPNITAVICGDGTERENLDREIRAAGLQDRVTLTGLIRHDEVLHYMQRARIFIHPSAYEGFGAVCLEALYAGCQVISFCDPMELQVKHWHIVKSEDEMREKALQLLKEFVPPEKVMLYSMSESVKAVMRLFEEQA